MRVTRSASNPILTGAATVLIVAARRLPRLQREQRAAARRRPTTSTSRCPTPRGSSPATRCASAGGAPGTIARIKPRAARDGRVYATLALELEQTVGPLPADTIARVRPRSTLGLKYLELTPGDAKRDARRGRDAAAAPGARPRRARPGAHVFDARDARATCAATSRRPRATASPAAAPTSTRRSPSCAPVVRRLEPGDAHARRAGTDLAGSIDGLRGRGGRGRAGRARAARRSSRGADATLGALAAARGGARRRRSPSAADAGRPRRARCGGSRRCSPTARRCCATCGPARACCPAPRAGSPTSRRRGAPVLRRAIDLGPDLEDALHAVGRLVAEPNTGGAVARPDRGRRVARRRRCAPSTRSRSLQLPRPVDAQRVVDDQRGRRARHVVPLHPDLPADRGRSRRPSPRPSCTSRRTAASTASARPATSRTAGPPIGNPDGPAGERDGRHGAAAGVPMSRRRARLRAPPAQLPALGRHGVGSSCSPPRGGRSCRAARCRSCRAAASRSRAV